MIHDVEGCSVLVVDDAGENLRLLSGVLKRGGLVPRPVLSGRLAIEAAAADPPDLVLLDVGMPDLSGLEVCKWFKQDERLRSIPIIFLSGREGIDDKVEAFRVGGVDYITKPFQDQEVVARVKTHLRLRRLQAELASNTLVLEARIEAQVEAVTAAQLGTIFALARLAEARDDRTGQHIERVQTFARVLAERMRELGVHAVELTRAFIDDLFQTASLHDIGKVGVPDAILLKPGPLTPAEFDRMKQHCTLGADTLAAVLERHPGNPFLRMGVEVARSHHERWDGAGYPDGLAAAEIPLAARIVCACDAFDAMTTARPYRPALTEHAALGELARNVGTQFDARVVAVLADVVRDGSYVAHVEAPAG